MADVKVVGRWSAGKVQITKFEGDYKGTPSFKYQVQKRYQDGEGKWASTNYFTKGDIRDLLVTVNSAAMDSVITAGGSKAPQKSNSSAPKTDEKPSAPTEDFDPSSEWDVS